MGDTGEQEERVDGPLLDPAACDDEVPALSAVIVVPKRKIIIEPLLMLFALIAIPMSILTQQFIVAKIIESKHLNSTGNHSQDSYCSINQSSAEYMQQQEIQAEAARFNIYSSLCFSVPALFVTVFLGSLSDKLGRKAAILPPLFGGLFITLTYLVIILLDLPIWYLLIGRLVEGLCGSYLALLMGCFAYIADMTPRQEDRQFRIAVVELIMFLAGIVGPAGLGLWIEEIGYLYPFLAVLAGFILCILYAVLLIPETVVRQPHVKLCDPGHLQKCVLLFVRDDGSGRQWKLATLILSFFIVGTVQLSNGGVRWLTFF
jgi:PCFT/HCP family folate transporter-like MFS transporter 1/3